MKKSVLFFGALLIIVLGYYFLNNKKEKGYTMIELKNVNKIYNNKVHALKNINLKVEEGDIYGIIGYSGAGKSTLVRLLNGLEIATDGEVIIEGDDFNKITESERRLKRQRIGMIFQHFNLLWSRTVAENIAFPLEILGNRKVR